MCQILQKYCIFEGSKIGATTFLERPSNLGRQTPQKRKKTATPYHSTIQIHTIFNNFFLTRKSHIKIYLFQHLYKYSTLWLNSTYHPKRTENNKPAHESENITFNHNNQQEKDPHPSPPSSISSVHLKHNHTNDTEQKQPRITPCFHMNVHHLQTHFYLLQR